MPVWAIDWWKKEPAVKTWQLLSKCICIVKIFLWVFWGGLCGPLLYCSWKMITYLLPWICWILYTLLIQGKVGIFHIILKTCIFRLCIPVFCLEPWLQSDAGVLSTLSFEEYYRIPSVLWCPAVHALHWIYLLGS